MSEFYGDRSSASDPLPIAFSDAKLRRLQPELYGLRSCFFKCRFGLRQLNAREARTMIAEHMQFGDTRAALVVRIDPLLVAAYTDEQDAVLLLRFPQFLVTEHQLAVGTRLLTANTYGAGKSMFADIIAGPLSTGRFVNYHPVIAEFVSDDEALITRRKQAIRTEEWRRAAERSKSLLSQRNIMVRDGRPTHSMRLGKPLLLKS
jgi:hypothetical protein